MPYMLDYAQMNDFKIEAVHDGDQAIAEAIAAILKDKQKLPVIVF